MKTLDEIALLNRTDKASNYHNYTRVYEQLFRGHREHAVNLLEIGVLNGGSIKTWSEYFYHEKSLFTGVDINPDCKQYADNRIKIEIGDQSDVDWLDAIGNRCGKFDIVIDDGSHIATHQELAFKTLWKHVNSGGYFVCEDTHTSYGEFKENYLDNMYSGINYFKELIDTVNGQFFGNGGDIDSIQFYNSLVIIKKK